MISTNSNRGVVVCRCPKLYLFEYSSKHSLILIHRSVISHYVALILWTIFPVWPAARCGDIWRVLQCCSGQTSAAVWSAALKHSGTRVFVQPELARKAEPSPVPGRADTDTLVLDWTALPCRVIILCLNNVLNNNILVTY